MRFPSCQFNNMPGLEACGRCGARLEAPQGESFMPPRPRGWARIRRNAWLGLKRVLNPGPPRPRKRRVVPGIRRTTGRFRRFINPDLSVPWWRDSPVLAALFSVALPGSGHLYRGRRDRGLLLLAAAFVLAVVATRYLYTTAGAWAFGGYCMVAAGALFDCVLVVPGETPIQRYLFGLATVIGLWILLTPVAEGLNRLWPTYIITIQSQTGPFPPGTTLALDRRAYRNTVPQRGDVVMTRQHQLDVVLGCPEEHVLWKEGVLYIDDEPQPGIRPFSRGGKPPDFRVFLPADYYLVLPHAVGAGADDSNTFQNLVIPEAVVHRNDILYRYAGPLPVE
jgi:hypothetical protein